MTLVLAIDVGTESVRAAVFADDGHRLGQGVRTHDTTYPRPGWAEQDPDQWWQGVVEASRDALAEADTRSVAAVVVATTASSVVLLDERGDALRPAILWMDARASAESARTAEVSHDALRYAGGSDSSEWLVPKAMWVAANEPDIYRRAHRIGEAVDLVTLRLTGSWVGSRLNATCKWNYDDRVGALPADLYTALGVPDLADRLPDDIRPVGAIVGEVTARAAALLGLESRPIVAVGGIDAHLTLVPLAGLHADPVSVIAGTSNAFIAELDEPSFSSEIWGPYPRALTDRWLVEGGQVSAGSSLTWLAERVLQVPRAELGALVRDASAVPAARHGVLALADLMGNRTPLRDPLLRGGMLGATLGTEPAVLYRAMVESVAYGTRSVLESFERVGVATDAVCLAGGIQHNPLWLQTTADVLGRPIEIVEDANLTLAACGALAVAAADGVDVVDAARAFAPTARTVEPDASAASALDEGYALHGDAVAATRDVQHRLARLTVGGAS